MENQKKYEFTGDAKVFGDAKETKQEFSLPKLKWKGFPFAPELPMYAMIGNKKFIECVYSAYHSNIAAESIHTRTDNYFSGANAINDLKAWAEQEYQDFINEMQGIEPEKPF